MSVPPELATIVRDIYLQMRPIRQRELARIRQRGGDAAVGTATHPERRAEPAQPNAVAAATAPVPEEGSDEYFTLNVQSAFNNHGRVMTMTPSRETDNLNAVLVKFEESCLRILRDRFLEFRNVRFHLQLSITYAKPRPDGEEILDGDMGATTPAYNIMTMNELHTKLRGAVDHLRIANDAKMRGASGLTIHRIN
jgi:hypothetical protein